MATAQRKDQEINWRKKAYELWRMLDDIDSLDDQCKSDEAAFRTRARAIQQRRFDIVGSPEIDSLYADFYGK